MDRQLEILALADEYEKVEYRGASAYLIINKKIEQYPCLFGFVQFPNDEEIAKNLFDQLQRRASQRGYTSIVGPVNYCTWMDYRWTIENFDLKLFPDCENPPYYPQMIKKFGYRELYTYRSALIDMENPMFHVGKTIYEEKLLQGFSFKLYEKDALFALSKEVYDISIDAFEGSFLYSALPYEYFKRLYLTWIDGLNSGMIVAYWKGAAVGYVFGYDSPFGDVYISKTSAVKKEFQADKLYTALLYLGCRYVMDKGYSNMMYHFQCEQKNTFRRFEKTIESSEKRYAVYIKEWEAEGDNT